jgi:hypothetical protein
MEPTNLTNAEELVTDADLFADELEEHISNLAAGCLSTIGCISSVGSYCTISTVCFADSPVAE